MECNTKSLCSDATAITEQLLFGSKFVPVEGIKLDLDSLPSNDKSDEWSSSESDPQSEHSFDEWLSSESDFQNEDSFGLDENLELDTNFGPVPEMDEHFELDKNVGREIMGSLLQDQNVQTANLRNRDIICGRTTKQIETHPGNCWFRGLVLKHKDAYTSTRKRVEKQAILDDLINKIFLSGGRFVAKKVKLANDKTEPWCLKERPLDDAGARVVYVPVEQRAYEEKVRKALRRDEHEQAKRVAKREHQASTRKKSLKIESSRRPVKQRRKRTKHRRVVKPVITTSS